jgi:outer membrane protein OmpA-like peptidoglycan-associated protein
MAGFSADIELVRPAFSPGDTPGVDVALPGQAGTFSAGTLVQLEKAPLVLYRYGDQEGTVIENRLGVALGASLEFSRNFSARAVLPLAYDFPGTATDFAGDPFGSGDLQVGARAHVWHWGPLDVGAHADVLVPVGAVEAWKGEGSVRGLPGLLLAAGVGPISLRSDTAFMLRGGLDTGADFTLGSELVENAALVASIWEDHFYVHAGVASRVGLATLTAGGAENVAELLAGAQLRPHRDWTVDVGLGRGLTEGYGTTRFRVLAGVTWTRRPRPPAPAPVVATFVPPPDVLPDQVFIEEIAKPPPPKVEWKEQELARVELDQIVIRDPIQFEFAKDVILPISLPTLKFVGSLMGEHPEIVHVVIEGHASEEGSYYYNYDLAKKRADAIWRALIEAGVSPTRISTRSMGEVEPRNLGSEEAALAENRRVIFHIVKRLAPGEKPPEYKLEIKRPWSGEPEVLPTPPPVVLYGPDGKPIPVDAEGRPLPPAPPPAPAEIPDEDAFDDGEEAP